MTTLLLTEPLRDPRASTFFTMSMLFRSANRPNTTCLSSSHGYTVW